MKISGSYTINAPRQQVWEALNDIDVLARVVPGCQRLEQIGENEYEGTLKIGIAAVRGTYTGKIRLQDIQPPHHYKLVANGRSATGVVDGTGTVDLEEQGEQTLLRYGGEADIGGTLASVGQRLIEGASRQLLNQSLKTLEAKILERAAGEAPAAVSEPESAVPAPQPEAVPDPSEATGSAPAAQVLDATVPPVQPPERPAVAAPPAPERKSVIVPEHEQLKPEALVQGMISDFLKERPWAPWVIVALLLGYIFGRSRN